jgi:hypothetical protein
MGPRGMLVVVPSRLRVGEEFAIKVRLLGEVRAVPCSGQWNTPKPGCRGPFNLNVERKIQFMDNTLPEWSGALSVEGDGLEGPRVLEFDGTHQGAYPSDRRPIKTFGGLRWSRPGFRFLRLTDPRSGCTASANPVYVTVEAPTARLYWGDPHWQTIFSDGIRCPEELYAFARDEGFLDFGAISDHMEAVTARQWEYFQAVTNDYNEPGRFVTLQGQEWTHHVAEHGAPGHRNIYYREDRGPALRCTDPDCNTLTKLWSTLDSLRGMHAVAIPHHPANVVMGVDWEQGWNPKYEKAVEIHSVWGNSERHADDGNPLAISPETLGGEMRGRHVIDALKRGYRLGFVGGGDIHDGRPGDDLHNESYPPKAFTSRPEGFTGVWVPELTRGNVFDAVAQHRSYATTKRRIYLDAPVSGDAHKPRIRLAAASEEGIAEIVVVRNGVDTERLLPDDDPRVVTAEKTLDEMAPRDFCYLRLVTRAGTMAWSSPFWGDTVKASRGGAL